MHIILRMVSPVAEISSLPVCPLELNGQQIARRWRQCNPRSPPPFENIEDEDEWRTSVLELLSRAHTIGGANALSFEIVKTNYSVSPPHTLLTLTQSVSGYGFLSGIYVLRLEMGVLFCWPQDFVTYYLQTTCVPTHQHEPPPVHFR